MVRLLFYLAVSAVASIFSWYYWQWGNSLGELSSLQEIPGFFNASNIIASILFFGSSWYVLHKGGKNSKVTIPILIGLVVWYASVLILGQVDFFALTPLFAPNIIFAFILLFIGIKKLLKSQAIQSVFQSTPLHWIMAVQVFRVMGVGFLALYAARLLPGTFAIPTGLGDVFIGITAPLVAYLYSLRKSFSKSIAILWNYLGLADLVMAIVLGIGTYSEPFQIIQVEISNAPIALYPLVIIPVFAVPLSVLLHLFTLKALRKT